MSEAIRGFSFPFRIDSNTGGVAGQSGDEKLKENVVHILMTTIGERVMNRDYGAGLRHILHDPNNDALWAIVQHQIAKAISRQEPRVLLQTLKLSQEGANLTIAVEYVVRRTRKQQAISVPIPLGGL